MTPRQLTAEDCKAMVGTWARAARNAVAAGFDTIEIHAAHGYLLASFLSPVSNTRNDEYGGDRAGRMRLLLQITEAVRAEMPATMPLFVRVSSVDGTQEGWNMDDTVVLARELKARGVDVIDCSSGGIAGAATAAQVPRSLGFQVPFAERVRREAGIPTMAVGIILEAQQAEAVLHHRKLRAPLQRALEHHGLPACGFAQQGAEIPASSEAVGDLACVDIVRHVGAGRGIGPLAAPGL